MTFKRLGEPKHDGILKRKCAPIEARRMIQQELEEGKTPTEAFENVAMKVGPAVPTLASVRKGRNPGSRSMDTQMELLCMLQRTLKGTVNPESPVPGYIQVSILCASSTHEELHVYTQCIYFFLVYASLTENFAPENS